MNRTAAIIRDKIGTQTSAGSINDKMAVGVIGVASLLIGCWAVVTLVAGTVANGGSGGLVANLLRAIS